MSWNIGENRNLFPKLKSKMGLYDFLPTTQKTSPGKCTLTLVEMQELLENEKMDSWNEISCLKWTLYNGGRKACISFKTEMEKLNNVVYRYRNITYVKYTEMELKVTAYEKRLFKRVYLLSYIDLFFKRCIVLDKTTVHKKK